MSALIRKLFLVATVMMALSCGDSSTIEPRMACGPEHENNRSCETFDAGCAIGYQFSYDYPYPTAPCFNPSNSDEFVYREVSVSKNSLVKFNRSTGEKKLLLDNFPMIGQPSWGRSGWVVFSTLQWKIFKIRDDGTGLQQISFTPRDIGPEFDPTGRYITYARNMEFTVAEIQANPDLANLYKSMVVDLDGNVVDSICRPIGMYCTPFPICAWVDPTHILAERGPDSSGAQYGLSIYDFLGAEEIVVDEAFTGWNQVTDLAFDPVQQQVYYTTTKDNMNKVSREGGSPTMLKKYCDNRNYEFVSVSDDGTQLLSLRIDAQQLDLCQIALQHHLVIMDPDGCNEQIIEIP